MTISALPPAPSPADTASQFNSNAFAWVAALDDFTTEANALQTDVNSKQATVVSTYAAALANGLATAAANAATASAAAIQAEYARDQAIAGLGAADNSQALVDLLGGIAYATDMALQTARELGRLEVEESITTLLYAVAQLLDLAGVTARAIAGGDVQLRAGTAGNPSLRPDGDQDTGLLFPSADTVAVATGGVEALRVDANQRVGIGTTAPSGLLDVNDDHVRVRTAKTPASAGAAGNAGDLCWDSAYVYVCTATNTWCRAPITSW